MSNTIRIVLIWGFWFHTNTHTHTRSALNHFVSYLIIMSQLFWFISKIYGFTVSQASSTINLLTYRKVKIISTPYNAHALMYPCNMGRFSDLRKRDLDRSFRWHSPNVFDIVPNTLNLTTKIFEAPHSCTGVQVHPVYNEVRRQTIHVFFFRAFIHLNNSGVRHIILVSAHAQHSVVALRFITTCSSICLFFPKSLCLLRCSYVHVFQTRCNEQSTSTAYHTQCGLSSWKTKTTFWKTMSYLRFLTHVRPLRYIRNACRDGAHVCRRVSKGMHKIVILALYFHLCICLHVCVCTFVCACLRKSKSL